MGEAHRTAFRASRARLLGGASLLCLMLATAQPGHAADAAMPVKATPPASFYERFYVSLEGGLALNASPANLDFGPFLNAMPPQKPGNFGGMAGVAIGGRFDPALDWRLAWQGTWLGERTAAGTSAYSTPFGPGTVAVSSADKLWFQTFDGEVGYRFAGAPNIRAFLGARVVNAENRLSYADDDGGNKVGNFEHRTSLWGVGPRAGLDASVPIATNTSLDVMGAGAVLFAHRSHDFTFDYIHNPGPPNPSLFGTGTTSYDRNVTVYNLEGSAALGYKMTPGSTLQVGYRVQQWWNLVPTVGQANIDGGFVSGEGNVLVHGPFAKITVALP